MVGGNETDDVAVTYPGEVVGVGVDSYVVLGTVVVGVRVDSYGVVGVSEVDSGCVGHMVGGTVESGGVVDGGVVGHMVGGTVEPGADVEGTVVDGGPEDVRPVVPVDVSTGSMVLGVVLVASVETSGSAVRGVVVPSVEPAVEDWSVDPGKDVVGWRVDIVVVSETLVDGIVVT